MTSRISLSFIRQNVIAGIVLCLLVTGYSLLSYPAILLPLRMGIGFTGIFLLVLSGYVIIVWRLTHRAVSDARWIANRGLTWGIIIAGFWLLEIVAGNLLNPKYSVVHIIYFGSSIIAFSLPFFAGAEAARRADSVRTGTLVGLSSGIVSGLLTVLSLMAVTYLFLNIMLQDPQNLFQFQRSGAPDLVTFVIGDSLAGATGHLAIGLVLGPGLGAMGGVVGQFLARRKSNPALP